MMRVLKQQGNKDWFVQSSKSRLISGLKFLLHVIMVVMTGMAVDTCAGFI